jgi:uncharacterized protein (TIGR02996 family)
MKPATRTPLAALTSPGAMPHEYENAFLQYICANPDDDTPRLVYADWLEDHGRPERAEVIRVQIELAALPVDDPRRPALEAREAELLAAYGAAWLRPLREAGATTWIFRRGFAEAIGLPLPRFVECAGWLCERDPVREVKLSWAREGRNVALDLELVRRLADCRHLARLEVLDLGEAPLGHAAARALLTSRHLGSRLARLVFSDEDSTLHVARTLARADRLSGLRELHFQGWTQSDLGDEGAGALAGAPHLAGLTALTLLNCRLGPYGAEALAHLPFLTRLAHLYLGNGGPTANRVGARGARALASTRNLAGLAFLGLGGNAIQDAGVEALAGSRFLGGLRVLHLADNGIGPAGLQALAASPNLASVAVLDLSNNWLGEEGAFALAGSPYASSLRVLRLAHARIGDNGVEALANCPRLADLTQLDLTENMVGYGGGEALIHSPYLTHLQTLRIGLNALPRVQRQALHERFGAAVEI